MRKQRKLEENTQHINEDAVLWKEDSKYMIVAYDESDTNTKKHLKLKIQCRVKKNQQVKDRRMRQEKRSEDSSKCHISAKKPPSVEKS